MSRSISAEELQSLAEEIAALTRSGVPLERGLSSLGRDLPRRTAQLAHELSAELAEGRDLVEMLRARQYPPLFCAVVESGVRTGRLHLALERLASALATMVELRRHLRRAMIYPAVVVALAYAAFWFSVVYVFPVMVEASADLSRASAPAVLLWLRTTGLRWCWLPPLLAAVVWWWLSRGESFAWLGSPLRRLREASQLAVFSELFSLLVEQDQPLDEAVRLAADASGSPRLARQAGELADQLRGGGSRSAPAGFPPLLGWVILSSRQQPQLVSTFRRAAVQYRRRAEQTASWCHVYVPVLLTVVVGGSATLAYGVSVFLPWSLVMQRLVDTLS